jgi:hypothetical protein
MSAVTLTLSEEEARALCQVLDKYLPELRYELARIKLERDRHPLVVLDNLLERLRGRLGELAVAPDAPLRE